MASYGILSQRCNHIENPVQILTIFYDGACPLCMAEILLLQDHNQKKLLRFIDISSTNYAPECHGLTCEKAMAEIHGRLDDGELFTGIDVFAEAYARAGFKRLAWIYSRRWLRPVLHFSYQLFAKYRHPISARIGPRALAWAKKRTLKHQPQQESI